MYHSGFSGIKTNCTSTRRIAAWRWWQWKHSSSSSDCSCIWRSDCSGRIALVVVDTGCCCCRSRFVGLHKSIGLVGTGWVFGDIDLVAVDTVVGGTARVGAVDTVRFVAVVAAVGLANNAVVGRIGGSSCCRWCCQCWCMDWVVVGFGVVVVVADLVHCC